MYVDTSLVILACTLSGGFNRSEFMIPAILGGQNMRKANVSSPENRPNNLSSASSCGVRARWGECPVQDPMMHPLHLFTPWMLTLSTLVILSMPTVLLRAKAKEKGLKLFAGNLFQLLGLLAFSTLLSEHPSVCYTFTVHACIRFLCIMDKSTVLLGNIWWWSLRYLSILFILGYQFAWGPAVSVVHWGPSPKHLQRDDDQLQCAYLSHLIGSVAPTLVLFCVRCVISSARYIRIHDD